MHSAITECNGLLKKKGVRVESVIDMEWGSGPGRRWEEDEEDEYSQNAAHAISKENILIL